jgi:hypothetical protein
MKKYIFFASIVVLVIAGFVISQGFKGFNVSLSGYEETPQALSTTGNGEFHARISEDGSEISYELSYSALEGNVTQAHIHFGAVGQTGGISLWLCGNSPPTTPPPGTQPCPAPPTTITGTLTAANVVGPAGQGITAGQFEEILQAMRNGTTYVNVHSSLYPGGEIRSQIDVNDERRHH